MSNAVLLPSRRLPAAAVFACLIFTLVLGFAGPARSEITVGGDPDQVSPSDPATWTASTDAKVGIDDGKLATLTIDDGSAVTSRYSYLGYDPLSSGTVTVTGTDSEWVSRFCRVGHYGSGTLNVTGGGHVANDSSCIIASQEGSSGSVTITGTDSTWTGDEFWVGFRSEGTLLIDDGAVAENRGSLVGSLIGRGDARVSGAGSQWNTGFLHIRGTDSSLTVEDGGRVTTGLFYGSLSNLYGDGTIHVHDGAILDDVDLVFDAARGLSQVLPFGAGGQMHLTVSGETDFGVGYKGTGSLLITEGRTVASWNFMVAFERGSNATAVVNGPGSRVACKGGLSVGSYGSGSLTVDSGAQVSNAIGSLGYSAGSTGTATVTGAASTWHSSGDLRVGYHGAGTLTIEDGGLVSVGGQLTIDDDQDGNAAVRMQSDGMLALFGDADDSLAQFLGLVAGSDAIEYWNGQAWSHLSNGILGTDYSLDYITAGDLDGYTTLTVHTYVPMLGDIDGDGDVDNMDIGMATGNFTGAGGSTIPEPATLTLLALTGLAIVRRKAAG
jgi:T5SS/PEP-CTERM-associated repeat protein